MSWLTVALFTFISMASAVEPGRADETFQDDIVMPDLFSISIEESQYDMLAPNLMMATDEEAGLAAMRSLKEGSEGAEKTLSALNSRGVHLMHISDGPSTSSTKAVKIKEEPMDEIPSLFDDKDSKSMSEIKEMMKQPSIQLPSRATTKQTTANRKPPSVERKRPGRKRLELPSEAEVDKITDPLMKKRLQNRKASRECRARKADYLGEMEEKVRHLESENAELSFKYNEVKKERGNISKENERLRMRLDQFEAHFKTMNISHIPEIAVC